MEANDNQEFAKVKKIRNRKDLNENNVYEVMELCAGNLFLASKKLNVKRSTLKAFIEKKKNLKFKIEGLKESLIDMAEAVLMQRMAEFKDLRAATYVLNSLGADRGWGEKNVPIEEDENKNNEETILDIIVYENRNIVI